MEEASGRDDNFIEVAGEIIAAYVSNNPLPASELPALIANVHSAVAGLAAGGPSSVAAPDTNIAKPTPAQIRRSIQDDGLVSFIDGKSYKTLKRHLTKHGLNPQSYRERYGLPDDYPVVAASYAAQRSALAKQIGLGRLGSLSTRE